MKKRLHILFHGTVQGVGFRFTTQSLARRLGLHGWVRNLRGGDVEIVAEGEEPDLKELVTRLQQEFSGYVNDTSADWQEPTLEFKEFGIRF